MELTRQHLEQVGSYVREHLNSWLRDASPPVTTVQLDPVYLERIVRVEEELKSQRELMKLGFDQIDKRFEQMRADTNARFEQVDRRFEQVDKRFEELRADLLAGFDAARKQTSHSMTVISVILGLMTVAVAVTNLL
ncbi:MAG: hypothetical protein EA382_16675 [Spirochaetaceae bacterium]|nr:MAG: hypothetical protein EA382_16675 [Spirochaetaceae bacterium]